MNIVAPPELQAILLAIGGGMLMGYGMFRLLPGMREDKYPPPRWVPVAIALTILGWTTYFIPQLTYDVLSMQHDIFQEFATVSLVWLFYMSALITTLYVAQRYRRGKRDS